MSAMFRAIFRALRGIFICAAFLRVTLASGEFYVAPNGNDSAPGTADKPFATLARARDAVRQLPADAPKRIIVRGGKYFGVKLLLTARDSGLVVEAAAGEKPILYGGVLVANWEKDGDGFYSAPLPSPHFDGKSGVRMLQVDEVMASRARYPAQGTLTYLSEFKPAWTSTTAGGFQRKPTQEELTTLKYKPEDVGASFQKENAQITLYHVWDESCVGVAGNDVARHILTLSPAPTYPPGAFGVKRYVIWNTREGMTSPGQWFHDRSRNRIVYWPLVGQDINKAVVIAPATETIIRVAGTAEGAARNVCLRGLTLGVTNVPLIAAGFAAGGFEGAVSLDFATDCVVDGLSVTRVAGHAIDVQKHCAGARVANCEVSECGAGGIYVSGSGSLVTNNSIHDIGVLFSSGVGIGLAGRGTVISHNEIHGTPYSAIAYGGEGNLIEGNLIYDCMKVLHDGAAIYMGGAKRTVIRGNLVRQIGVEGGTGASAFYLDEQSEGCTVEGNLALSVSWPLQNNMARNNTLRGNVFTSSGDATLAFGHCSGYTMEKNVVYAPGKIRIVNIGAVKTWSKNLFYSRIGTIEGAAQKGGTNTEYDPFLKWDTVEADPLFQNLEAGNYRYEPGSPTFQLGIQPLDMSHVGRVKSQGR